MTCSLIDCTNRDRSPSEVCNIEHERQSEMESVERNKKVKNKTKQNSHIQFFYCLKEEVHSCRCLFSTLFSFTFFLCCFYFYKFLFKRTAEMNKSSMKKRSHEWKYLEMKKYKIIKERYRKKEEKRFWICLRFYWFHTSFKQS